MSNHILVVDDDITIREMARAVLEFADYRVETAADGREALATISRDPPSAMLLDLRMPVLDGWGLARRLHEHGQWVPTVVMTAEDNPRRCCAEVGADACLAKPFDMDDLLAAVAQVRAPPRPDNRN